MREGFAVHEYAGLRRLFEAAPIPADVYVDMFVYITRGEIPYVENLVELPTVAM